MQSRNPQKLSMPETIALRRLGGRFLRELREDRGYSQATLTKVVGYAIKQYISQVETGRTTIAAEYLRIWADALRVNHRDFALIMMRFYDPEMFAMIFENEPEILSGAVIPDFQKFLALSEAGLAQADAEAAQKGGPRAVAASKSIADKPPRRRISPETEAAIHAARAKNPGLSMPKIAQSVGVSTSTVQRVLGAL